MQRCRGYAVSSKWSGSGQEPWRREAPSWPVCIATDTVARQLLVVRSSYLPECHRQFQGWSQAVPRFRELPKVDDVNDRSE